MSTIYHPTQVVVLFKRIVNAISTFSISHHYLLKHAKPGNNQSEDVDGKEQANLDWPWWIFRTSWGWPWSLYGSHRSEGKYIVPNFPTTSCLTTATSLVHWSWFTISNSSGQILSATEDLYPPPTHSPQSSSSQSRKNPTKSRQDPANEETMELDTMHQLLQNPALYDPLRVPRNPIVLCHGV